MARKDRAPSTDIRVGTVLCAIIAIVIIAILWKGPWWVHEHGTDNQYQIDRAQQGIITQVRDAIKEYDSDAKSLARNLDPAFQEVTGARQADVKLSICSSYGMITIVPTDISLARDRICG